MRQRSGSGCERIVPAIRWGMLVKTSPVMDSEAALKILSSLKDEWPDLRRQHLKMLKGVAPGTWAFVDDPEESERPAITFDLGTPVLTFPRCHNDEVDTRLCIAACPAPGRSTKVWARVGPDDRRKGIAGPLPEAAGLYRRIATASTRWIYGKLRAQLRDAKFRVRLAEEFEVAALASSDPKLAKILSALDSPAAKGASLVRENRALNQRFSDLAGEERMWSRLAGATWFSAPADDEYFSPTAGYSDGLYVMRRLPDRTQLLGVAYDGRTEGKWPSESSLGIGQLLGRQL